MDDEWIDGWMMDGRMDGWWMDGWMDGWWMDGWWMMKMMDDDGGATRSIAE